MILKITRFALAFLLIIFFGFFGIVFFFADYGQGENVFTRMGLSFVYNFIIGIFVGVLAFPLWKISVSLAWGVGVVGLIGLIRTLIGQRDDSIEVLLIVFAPITGSLLGGFAGYKLVSKIKKLKSAH